LTSVQGKVAIITGAGSGIGRATAQLLARNGAKVTAADVSEAWGRETVALIEEVGGEAIFFKADVTSGRDVQHMVDETVKAFGRVDILHNNAGMMVAREGLDEVSEEAWDLVVDVSLKGAYLGAKAVFPHMEKQGGGVIINTSSMGALSPLAHSIAYGAAKAGVISLTRTLAQMGVAHGIRSNTVLPGSVATRFRDSYPEEIRAKMPAQALTAEDIALGVYRLITDDGFNGAAMKVIRGKESVEYWSVESFDYQWSGVQGMERAVATGGQPGQARSANKVAPGSER